MVDYRKAADAQLIAACLGGVSEAWEELLRRYQRLIYSIPYKYQLHPDEAADVFQSVCMVLLEGLKDLRDESKLSSWLITTTMRECWKLKRQQRREVSNLDDEESGPVDVVAEDPWPDEIVQSMEEQQLVRQAMELLDDRCKTLLTYLFYQKEAWSYEQIAQDLEMPVPSIGPTRGRCLKKLQRILKKFGIG